MRHDCAICGHGTFLYQDGMRESVEQFKYAGMKEYAKGYAALMAHFEGEWAERWEYPFLVPVPIHKRRYQERGYNQAAELAKALSVRMGLPVWEGLARTRNTAPLQQMSAVQRRRSLEGAFGILDERSWPRGTAILIDDIYTSGSTVEACARAMRQRRPEQMVVFWTLTIRAELT